MTPFENKTLILSSVDVQQIVSHYGLNPLMDALIERLSVAIRSFDSEKTSIPVRSGFHYETPQTGLIEWMPLFNQGENVVLKVVGYHPSNPAQRKMPTIVSTISAYDTDTGHLVAVMDGVFSTALRTGAASAVASRFMARPDSSVLGLIGCGTQAITQLHALSRIFDLKKVLIYDIDQVALNSFAERCSMMSLEAEIISSNIREIVESSDILCTATSIDVGTGPLFSGLETKPHLHINAIGSDFPGKVEIPLDLLQKSFVCPDFKEQAILEGECQQIDPERIKADLVKVIQNPNAFENVKNERSIFDSTGWALEDQVAMEMFLEYAFELGLGREIEIEAMSRDAKNPYHFLGETDDTFEIKPEIPVREPSKKIH